MNILFLIMISSLSFYSFAIPGYNVGGTGLERAYAGMAAYTGLEGFCLKISEKGIVTAGFSPKGFRVKSLRSSCYHGLAIKLKDKKKCEKVIPMNTSFLDGSKFNKEHCIKEIGRSINSGEPVGTNEFYQLMSKMGYSDGNISQAIKKDKRKRKKKYKLSYSLLNDFFFNGVTKDFETRLSLLPDYNNPINSSDKQLGRQKVSIGDVEKKAKEIFEKYEQNTGKSLSVKKCHEGSLEASPGFYGASPGFELENGLILNISGNPGQKYQSKFASDVESRLRKAMYNRKKRKCGWSSRKKFSKRLYHFCKDYLVGKKVKYTMVETKPGIADQLKITLKYKDSVRRVELKSAIYHNEVDVAEIVAKQVLEKEKDCLQP